MLMSRKKFSRLFIFSLILSLALAIILGTHIRSLFSGTTESGRLDLNCSVELRFSSAGSMVVRLTSQDPVQWQYYNVKLIQEGISGDRVLDIDLGPIYLDARKENSWIDVGAFIFRNQSGKEIQVSLAWDGGGWGNPAVTPLGFENSVGWSTLVLERDEVSWSDPMIKLIELAPIYTSSNERANERLYLVIEQRVDRD